MESEKILLILFGEIEQICINHEFCVFNLKFEILYFENYSEKLQYLGCDGIVCLCIS